MAANLYKPRPTSSMLRAPGADAGNNSQNLRSLTPGSVVLDRYLVQKVIGRGGMATVYVARNQETERLVALKILDPEISSDPSYVERFRREARAAGRIRSDHVVAIYDLGTDDSGTLVLVMEYLEGQTVQQALRNGRLPLQRAMILGRQLCEGLAAAHENGVIHRDLKPANLFIEKLTGGAEKLKILDFGISKLADVSSQELTRAGQTLGTLAYMAPEQIRGAVKGNDPRIDLYSAGVSLFLMFTAKRPIDAEDTVQLLQAVLEKPALTLAQAAGVEFPPSVEAFIARALVKDPTRRYQSALEMRDALLQAAHDSGIDAIAHFSSPNSNATPRLSAPPSQVTPASGVSHVLEAAPTYTPPSGVIVSGVEPSGPMAPSPSLALPSFDDDDEEGKTEVRIPGGMQTSGPSSPLPLAGRRPTGVGLPAADFSPSHDAGPNVMRAPTMPPRGPLSGNNQPTIPPNGRSQTIQGVPPAPVAVMDALPESPPTQALDVFESGGPPGYPPPPQLGAPGHPALFGMPPPAQPFEAPPAAAPAPKRSSMRFVLLAACVVSCVMIGVAGFVAMGARGTEASTAGSQAHLRAPAPVARPAPTTPTPTPSAPIAAAPVAQTLIPTPPAPSAPIAAAPVAAPPAAPEVTAPAVAAPVEAQAAAPTAPEETPSEEPRAHRGRGHHVARVAHDAPVAAPAPTRPTVVRAAPAAATTTAATPRRTPRRVRTGVVTAMPF